MEPKAHNCPNVPPEPESKPIRSSSKKQITYHHDPTAVVVGEYEEPPNDKHRTEQKEDYYTTSSFDETKAPKPRYRRIQIRIRKKLVTATILLIIFIVFPILGGYATLPSNLNAGNVGTFIGTIFSYWIDVGRTFIESMVKDGGGGI